ncbi:ALP1-like protein [Tanacetum coccineum]
MNSYTFMGIDVEEGEEISERTSRTALDHFCQDVMEIYGPGFLRKPTVTDIENVYLHHEEKHGFPEMLGSLDCMDWEWFGCPYAFKAQYVRRDHSPNPFILLEAVTSQDLWIWHAFFELAPLIKTNPEPSDDDHKRILYKQKHKSARKDVERAFGVLKKKWANTSQSYTSAKKRKDC